MWCVCFQEGKAKVLIWVWLLITPSQLADLVTRINIAQMEKDKEAMSSLLL